MGIFMFMLMKMLSSPLSLPSFLYIAFASFSWTVKRIELVWFLSSMCACVWHVVELFNTGILCTQTNIKYSSWSFNIFLHHYYIYLLVFQLEPVLCDRLVISKIVFMVLTWKNLLRILFLFSHLFTHAI